MVKVRVEFEPEANEADETVTSEFASEEAPGLTVRVGSVEVTALPPIVEPIVVALPDVDAVNTAE
jgi:hypothetical protein